MNITLKKTKTGVQFLDAGEIFAFLKKTATGGFLVSATRQADGRIRYMHDLCSVDAVKLGIDSSRAEN